jgi:hypothetical protein
MTWNKKLCSICAWREFCKKKFLASQDISFNCPDFTRDLTIREEKNEKNTEVEKE